MQSVSFEFNSRDEAKVAADMLLRKYGVTGELDIRPLENGKWLFKLVSEKELRESTLEKIGGRRLES